MKKEKKLLISIEKTKQGIHGDNWHLYENGEVIHEYDRHSYKGGYNLKDTYLANEIPERIKKEFIKKHKS